MQTADKPHPARAAPPKRAAATQTDLPTREDFPDFIAAFDNLHALYGKRDHLAARIKQLRSQLPPGAQRKAELQLAAMPYVVGGKNDDNHKAAQARFAELAAAEKDLPVVGEAIELQERIVATEKAKMGAAIRTTIHPQHQALARRIADAMRALGDALRDEQTLRDYLDRMDVNFAMPLVPVAFARVGDDRKPSWWIDEWLRWIDQQNYL